MILTFVGCNIVQAQTVQNKFYDSFIGQYHYVDSSGKFGDFEYFRRSGDNSIAYCIEPGVSLSSDIYNGYYDLSTEELASAVHLTTSQLVKISQIAYYGWGYNGGHQGNNWIVATQALIWKTLGRNFQFTSKNYSPNPWQYVIPTPTEVQSAMDEIESLVNNHYRYPAFQTNVAKIEKGKSYSFIDHLNILNNYQVNSCENCNAQINGNSLIVTPISTESGSVTLSKENNKWSQDFIVYHHDVGQDLIVPGNLDPLQYKVSFSVISGSLTIRKYDADNKSCNPQEGGSLSGAKYNLYKEDGTLVTTLTIGDDCSASVDNLELGKYYFQEIQAGTNYELDPTKYPIEITENNLNIVKVVYDEIFLGKVSIKKYDSENRTCNASGKAQLNGAVYGVYKENGELVTQLTIDENCSASTDKILLLGKYYVQEIKAPNGYKIDSQKHYFSVTKDNADLGVDLTLYDEPYKNELTIHKVYLTESGIKAEVGAVFEVISQTTNKKVATLIIDESGTASVTLPYDDYIIHQVSGKDDYMLTDDFEIVVDENSDSHQYVSLLNEPYSARLKVVKTDAITGNVIKKSGIKFKIYDVVNNKYICQQVSYPNVEEICVFETNQNGEFVTPFPLFPSTYRLEEVEQNIDGYLWNNKYLEFVIGKDSDTTYDKDLGVVYEVKFSNIPIVGEVNIHKVGEEIHYENDSFEYIEIPLNDVTYQLYAQNDIYAQDGTLKYRANELIGTYTTVNGDINISNLYLGDYCLKEISTADGYVLDETPYCFSLKYKDSYTPIVSLEFTLKNYLEKGKWEFTKTDFSSGEPLPNVKIELYTIDEIKIFEGYTDENGKILIENLPIGKYFFIESEAPSQYLLNSERQFFEIKANNEIVKSSLANKLIEVPNTSLSDSKVLKIVGIVVIILGIGYLVYDKYKRKK